MFNDEIRMKEFEIAQLKVEKQDIESDMYRLKDDLEPLELELNSE